MMPSIRSRNRRPYNCTDRHHRGGGGISLKRFLVVNSKKRCVSTYFQEPCSARCRGAEHPCRNGLV